MAFLAIKFLKVFVGIFNFIFSIFGLGLVAAGAWIRIDNKDWSSVFGSGGVSAVANVMLGTGAVIVLIAIIGFWAICKEHRCLLVAYFVMLLMLLNVEVASGIVAYKYKEKITGKLTDNLRIAIIHNYGEDSSSGKLFTKGVDYLQKHLKCCGASNYTDWKTSYWHKNVGEKEGVDVPATCCKKKDDLQCNKNVQSDLTKINTRGCVDAGLHFFRDHVISMGSKVGIGAGVFQKF